MTSSMEADASRSLSHTPHLWQGEWLSDSELHSRILSERLSDDIRDALAKPFEIRFLLDACERLSQKLYDSENEIYKSLEKILQDGFQMEKAERSKELAELALFLSRKDLERKIACELGIVDPFNFTRADHRQPNFERWAPLGFLVHVAPTNAFSAGAWSVLEGLLSANVNFLKTGGSDEIFAQLFFKHLIDHDHSASIAPRIFACRISSREQELLAAVFSHADGVIVWGDEGAISGVKSLAPAHARFIEWGPKISFAYFASDSADDADALAGLAYECCRMEQQACSSPQCVYLETDDKVELGKFARRLAFELEKTSASIPVKEPGAQEQAEITSVVELCRLESCLGLTEIIEAEDKTWRILVDYSGVLKASPLYRTIWVKPLLRRDIVKTLHPFRFFLQTAGLACKRDSISDLSDAFVQSGVLRITKCGGMLESYSGEPHDGVYALQRYSRKISLQHGANLDNISTFADLRTNLTIHPSSLPRQQDATDAQRQTANDAQDHATKVMSKEDFQAMVIADEYAELFFKSGGSSGEPKLSIFTYDDYHLQMRAAAYGLFAAGLDLKLDRTMNLFFAGGLYGGFVSFFTILETLKAVQFPMAGIPDMEMVANTIVSQKCNVLLGMPSYIIQLFTQHRDLFAKHKVVEKIFYAGEHFNESQRRYFQYEFGIKLIRSCGYGSVDAGPIGYQCTHCQGAIHHLHSGLHVLEILENDSDKDVAPGEPGRVVLTSLARAGQRIERYDIGDTARIVPGDCACGRRSTRFELLGRHGDVFKIGSAFFNYGKFAQIFTEELNYAGELQIVLYPPRDGKPEVICCRVSETSGPINADAMRKEILDNYQDLREIVACEGLLELKVMAVDNNKFERAGGSGKLRRIVDKRSQ